MVKVYRPGERKGNETCIVRGYIDGRQYEIATGTRDARAAKRYWEDEFKPAVRARRQLEPGTPETFAEVAAAYADARGIGKSDRALLDKMCAARIRIGKAVAAFGALHIQDVLPLHIAALANALYAGRRNETKNRKVYTPAAAVLHFAAKNELRPYMVVEKLPEREPETRRPIPAAAALLLANTDGDRHRLLTVLFYQGWRITETLGLRREHVDLEARTLRLWVNKAKRWKTVPMHEAVFEVLANAPNRPDGRIFPWLTRVGVYHWLRPLRERLGIYFTPHMARHEWGGLLRENGATSRDLVDYGTWTSERSTARYQNANSDHARAVLSRVHYDLKPVATPGRSKGKNRGRAAK